MMTPRTRRLSLSTLAGALLGVAIAGAVVFLSHPSQEHRTDLHEMLHEAVPLDANEREILDMKEQAFAQRRREIEMRLRTANGQLADAIAKNPTWSPEIEAATQEVERAAADLQRATLVHVFEMRAGLKPEHRPAYDRVLVDALRRGSQ
ncbi:periplasmic heavy metal sensor [Ralstonia pseudosolanacearum]|uniref:periplasmic heavy metal sensor n=1 Tax=Ralstonia solanacearum species complex TaxID=3116862 RepID=UPI0002FC073B|nr:periplasmic heavy metal sensor [Ralstonia pseudosolanacearum]MCK4125511.1 periplasmic heavy metal sensor [Ralstonia pseudosolanacearum]